LSRLLPPSSRLRGQAASFSGLLRQAAGGALSHPVMWRLVAHPSVTSFKNYLGVLAGGGHRPLEREQVALSTWLTASVSPSALRRTITSGVCASRCRRTLGLHLGPPSSWSDLVSQPRVFHSALHGEGGPCCFRRDASEAPYALPLLGMPAGVFTDPVTRERSSAPSSHQ